MRHFLSSQPLFYRYLLNTALMSAAFKRCLEEYVEYFLRSLVVNEASRQDYNIGVIVLAD